MGLEQGFYSVRLAVAGTAMIDGYSSLILHSDFFLSFIAVPASAMSGRSALTTLAIPPFC